MGEPSGAPQLQPQQGAAPHSASPSAAARQGVIAKFCIYNVLAHAYTIKDFSSYVVMSSCITQIRDELVVSIMQGTHQAGIHYFILENAYLEFSLKTEKQLRLVKNQQHPLPYEPPSPSFSQHSPIPAVAHTVSLHHKDSLEARAYITVYQQSIKAQFNKWPNTR